MIGLEYIVKLYHISYAGLSEKLGLTPSTVKDWISKRRRIPTAKIEALSKLFNIDKEYFQKELTKIEEIELELDYLNRISKRDSIEIVDTTPDDNGIEQEYLREIDVYQAEKQMKYEELKIETLSLKLKEALYYELFDEERGGKALEILNNLSGILNESASKKMDDKQQQEWFDKQRRRVNALRSMVYLMSLGFYAWDEEEVNFQTELHALLKKYDLLWSE
ncbi:helix-turn-helix domain-containing protein [Paenibacillus sp. 481]|uniref:helix-turn-helix domain-containing protein n=1 Tax=Paenibacillus sp. 481 TaxID=2835869 RepID=UPI001E59919D|nr:helix-turn-helix transcriptional regulator [Paenibacillus sp. 481]UHA73758.1 helix-turn-helix transcriptional regulator [Paenibacillus sp. 481]